MFKLRKLLQRKINLLIFAKPFTLIELIMMMGIMMILASILLPGLSKTRKKAKFTRWYAYNAQWSRDPDCVLNYNFQDGSGNKLTNTAVGCDGVLASSDAATANKYDAKLYDGQLRHKDNLPPETQATSGAKLNQFKWLSTTGNSGRWGAYKKALQFNGSNTYIYVPGVDALNFAPQDPFTIYASVRFATKDGATSKGKTVYSKSRFGQTDSKGKPIPNTFASQYDLYGNPAGANDEASFDYDTFDRCEQIVSKDSYDLKKTWLQVALVYDPNSTDSHAKKNCAVRVYVNGKLCGATTTANYEVDITKGGQVKTAEPFIMGASWAYPGGASPYQANYKFTDFSFFDGQIDEFVMIKKALSPAAVIGMSKMGTDE